MGLRGPKPLSPEIKWLKGNPGKRRLALADAASTGAAYSTRFAVEPPSYLTEKAERDAFNMALASLPANVARASDVNALARWAVWLNIFVQCRRSLGGNKTKPDRKKFDHRRMSDAEQHLIRLENHLGLTPAARGAIVQRLFQLPAAHFVAEAGTSVQPAPDDAVESPLGYLQRVGRPQH